MSRLYTGQLSELLDAHAKARNAPYVETPATTLVLPLASASWTEAAVSKALWEAWCRMCGRGRQTAFGV